VRVSGPLLFLVFAMLIAGAVWLLGLRWRSLRAMQAAEAEALPTDLCIACGERQLEPVAPQVVRCLACGFVGGDGMAAWQRARLAQQVARLTAPERAVLTHSKLEQAAASLETAHELLDQAWRMSWFALLGLSDRGAERVNALMGGLAQMQVAQLLLDEASWLLAGAGTPPVPDLDKSPLRMALETGQLADRWFMTWAVHWRIKQARQELQGVREEAHALHMRSSAAPA
jgi:hypothetical protein